MAFSVKTDITAVVNKTITEFLDLTDLGNSDLHNVILYFNNISSDWYKLEPSYYPRITPGQSVSFAINFTPTNTGVYQFRINVESYETSNFTDMALTVKTEQEDMLSRFRIIVPFAIAVIGVTSSIALFIYLKSRVPF